MYSYNFIDNNNENVNIDVANIHINLISNHIYIRITSILPVCIRVLSLALNLEICTIFATLLANSFVLETFKPFRKYYCIYLHQAKNMYITGLLTKGYI